MPVINDLPIFVFSIENLEFNKYLKVLANDSVIQSRFAHLVNSRRAKRLRSLLSFSSLFPPSPFLSLVVFSSRFSSSSSPSDSTEDSEDRQEPYQETHTRIPKAALLPPFPPRCPLFLLSVPHLASFYFFFSSSASRAIFLPLRAFPSPRASPGMIPLIRHEQVRRRFGQTKRARLR